MITHSPAGVFDKKASKTAFKNTENNVILRKIITILYYIYIVKYNTLYNLFLWYKAELSAAMIFQKSYNMLIWCPQFFI